MGTLLAYSLRALSLMHGGITYRPLPWQLFQLLSNGHTRLDKLGIQHTYLEPGASMGRGRCCLSDHVEPTHEDGYASVGPQAKRAWLDPMC